MFFSRGIVKYNPETSRWEPDLTRSEPSLDDQLRAWQVAEAAKIDYISPPSTTMYQNAAANEQTTLSGVSVLYTKFDEGVMRGTEKPAAGVGKVVAKVKPAGEAAAGVFVPPGQ
jgi:hypothetical protein